uniref:rRNA-processing protein FYV7 n=1 Tax=Trichuris muris TaxID=70415 RepID=A0A5S6QZU6_TRIMR
MSNEVKFEQKNFHGGKKRKLHTYEKARLAYERIQEEKKQKKLEKQQREKKRQEALDRSKQARMEKRKLLYKRSRKGQPALGLQIKYLLSKIEKQKTKDER